MPIPTTPNKSSPTEKTKAIGVDWSDMVNSANEKHAQTAWSSSTNNQRERSHQQSETQRTHVQNSGRSQHRTPHHCLMKPPHHSTSRTPQLPTVPSPVQPTTKLAVTQYKLDITWTIVPVVIPTTPTIILGYHRSPIPSNTKSKPKTLQNPLNSITLFLSLLPPILSFWIK